MNGDDRRTVRVRARWTHKRSKAQLFPVSEIDTINLQFNKRNFASVSTWDIFIPQKVLERVDMGQVRAVSVGAHC